MTERKTVDFDHHAPDYAADPWNTAARLAKECPVAWSPHHGGFWVVAGYEHVRTAAKDAKTFSSRHDLPNGCSAFQGINLPSVPGRYLPIELDPPTQLDWRRALAPKFSTAMAEQLQPLITEFCTYNLDRHIDSGRIEFIMDYTSAVTAMVTLHLLGLPLSRWRTCVETTHKINYTADAERDAVFGQFDAMLREVVKVAHERRAEPRDDLLTTLVQMKIQDQTLSDEDIASACGTIIAGGIDTTSAVVAGALKYLDENPAARQRLIEQPQLLPGAVDEFLRFQSPVTGLSRTAATDVELGGQKIKAGDRVLLMFHGANMDESAFPDPTVLDIERGATRHVTFGFGAHRCIGSPIAMVDIPIMLSQVLRRMPDYELLPEGVQRYPSIGTSNNYIAMEARFTPGPKMGVRDELRAEIEMGE